MCLIYAAVSILGLLPNVKDDESCQHKYAAKKKLVQVILQLQKKLIKLYYCCLYITLLGMLTCVFFLFKKIDKAKRCLSEETQPL